ncbi:Anaerobic nitric oxide reductase transcription regulator NorR [Sodalis praecaptivus]
MMVQEKLLRVIEYGELERVGGSQPLQVDVRLVCATNADLPALALAGDFRADLLDRLAFDVVALPPLRARPDDIMVMAEHFAIQMCRELGQPLFPGFSAEARRSLLDYGWPGNVRELKNVVERSLYRHDSSDRPLSQIIINPFEAVRLAPVSPTASSAPTLPLDLRDWLLEQEKRWIEEALARTHYQQRQAADMLALSYHQLRGMMKNTALKPVPDRGRSRPTAPAPHHIVNALFNRSLLHRAGALSKIRQAEWGFLLKRGAPAANRNIGVQ